MAPWSRDLGLVFVIGCPRSGTSWPRAMMSAHPGTYTGPETHFFSGFQHAEHDYQGPRGRGGLPAYWSRAEYLDLLREVFLSTISRLPEPSPQPTYFIEKSPEHTIMMELILSVFPSARVVHIIRDARPVVASLARARRDWEWARWWTPRGTDEAAHLWRHSVSVGRSVADRVERPDYYTEVRYEHLRDDSAGELLRLWRWLGLETDTKLAHRVAEDNTLTAVKARGGFSPPVPRRATRPRRVPESFFGSGASRPEEADLSRIQRLRVERAAGDLLRELGYEVGPDKLRPWELVLTSIRVRMILGLPAI